ncbi:MAG: FAD/NAD(P)-binding protein [Candidatus Tectimicrobiota bacterium]
MAAGQPMLPQLYTVRRRTRELSSTVSLELQPAPGASLSAFAPGQCNMLYAFGIGEIPISISGDPTQSSFLTHTVRGVGAVSRALCALPRGAMLGVRGPFGSAWPVDEAVGKDVILAAGGLGLAPLRPAMYYLLAHRERYGKVMLLYGTRSPEAVLYRRQLEHWRARLDLEVLVTVDHASADWHGSVGVLPRLMDRLPLEPHETMALLCGPEVMMRFTVMDLLHRGLTDEQIFVSMERNMQCAIGLCGHCQFGPTFVCKDGPVLRYDRIKTWFGQREV